MPWDKKANAIKISRAQPMLSDVLLCWHNFLFNLCIFFAGFSALDVTYFFSSLFILTPWDYQLLKVIFAP